MHILRHFFHQVCNICYIFAWRIHESGKESPCCPNPFSFSTWVLLLELFALTRRNSQLLLLHHWAFNFFQWSCMKKQTIVTKAYISRDFPFRWIFSCDIKTTTFFFMLFAHRFCAALQVTVVTFAVRYHHQRSTASCPLFGQGQCWGHPSTAHLSVWQNRRHKIHHTLEDLHPSWCHRGGHP